MLTMLRNRLDRDEEGFTLIELMVVVLIIAILIAIAIPTFLGAQDRARDRGAQSNLRNSLTAAKTIATDAQGFFSSATTPITPIVFGDMNAAETSIAHVAGYAPTVSQVGVTTNGTATEIALVSLSGSGTRYGLVSTSAGAVTYCEKAAANFTAAEMTAAACSQTSW